jgi:hypothetical protein
MWKKSCLLCVLALANNKAIFWAVPSLVVFQTVLLCIHQEVAMLRSLQFGIGLGSRFTFVR